MSFYEFGLGLSMDRMVRPWDRNVLTGLIPRDQGSPQVDGVHVALGRALSAGEAPFSGTGSGCRVAAFVGAVFSGPRLLNSLASVRGRWRGSIPRRFWRAGPQGALTS
jgi:hypothetical protein